MKEMSIPTTFSIDFVGGLTKVNDLISKGRARIYYKYGNRNGTWISDEFAEKLNSTLSHVPIVGTYDPETGDFVDHSDNGQKKAYGFVPHDANIAWEQDESGKDYLSADVYLWTGYWPEAAKIINKSQSMEILRESIVGDWKVVGGDYYFVYQSGSFKGLCALGDTVMPAFENSAFYSLDEESRSFFASLNEINRDNQEGGSQEMTDEKIDIVDEVVEETTETTEFEMVTETKSEESKEVRTLEQIPTADGGMTIIETIEESSTETETIETPEGQPLPEEKPKDEECPMMYSSEEYEARISEINLLNSRIADFESQITTLTSKVAELSVFQVQAVKAEKLAVIETFKRKLSEEEVSSFVESLDSYSTDELRTKLSVVLANKMLAEETTEVKPQSEFVSVSTSLKESETVKLLKKYKK